MAKRLKRWCITGFPLCRINGTSVQATMLWVTVFCAVWATDPVGDIML